jgi:hypothetical protein
MHFSSFIVSLSLLLGFWLLVFLYRTLKVILIHKGYVGFHGYQVFAVPAATAAAAEFVVAAARCFRTQAQDDKALIFEIPTGGGSSRSTAAPAVAVVIAVGGVGIVAPGLDVPTSRVLECVLGEIGTAPARVRRVAIAVLIVVAGAAVVIFVILFRPVRIVVVVVKVAMMLLLLRYCSVEEALMEDRLPAADLVAFFHAMHALKECRALTRRFF